MALEPYSPCPCGSGKKIKWCCQDLAKELKQISDLVESRQFIQALQLAEKSLRRNPKHLWLRYTRAACLTARRQYAEAREELEGILADDAQYERAWNLLVSLAVLGPAQDRSVLQDAIDALAGDRYENEQKCLGVIMAVLTSVEKHAPLRGWLPLFARLAGRKEAAGPG